MWELIGGVIALIVILLKLYLRQQEKKKTYEADKQKFDKALADRNANAMSDMFNELRKPSDSGDSGRPDDKKPS